MRVQVSLSALYSEWDSGNLLGLEPRDGGSIPPSLTINKLKEITMKVNKQMKVFWDTIKEIKEVL